MDQTPTVNPPVPTDDPEAALRRVSEFLDRIAGPVDVEIQDVYGHRYRIPGMLPARVEARFYRAIREIPNSADVQALPSAGDMRAWGDALLGLLADDRMIDAADEAFVSAFPKVIAAARTSAEAAGHDGGNRPSDLFPISEVALALSPFVVGGIRAAKQMLARFMPTPPTK